MSRCTLVETSLGPDPEYCFTQSARAEYLTEKRMRSYIVRFAHTARTPDKRHTAG